MFGGCPNRMDPPTTYSSMNAYDSMTVIKGSQTVIYGGGGPGGTVLFERNYAYHVNAANSDPFNPTAVQVNEPGREYWVRVSATF